MATAASSSSSSGIGFFGLLAILFIALKLTGYIDWSWWWVLAPLWGVFAVAAIIVATMLAVAIRNDRRRAKRLRGGR